ncbi:hypothetical protein [Microbacterium sp. SS28]|uniref:hypothetical protein n=1 Tax=Microbacterium sp. SS28 TaxID=2919948 RepID=UPI001FA95B02|nr:hypothetical protein [Microbacterium sp. SS28]
MLRRLAVLALLAATVSVAGCASPEPSVPTPTTSRAPIVPAEPTPVEQTPTPTPVVTAAADDGLILGYRDDQIAAVCIPALESEYPGATVTGPSDSAPWIGDTEATLEWWVYVPEGVTWTQNTDVTFPAVCSVSDDDPATPTLVYVGVVDH